MRRKRLLIWWKNWQVKYWFFLFVFLLGIFWWLLGNKNYSISWLVPQPEVLDWQEDLKLHLFEVESIGQVKGNNLPVKLKGGVEVNFSPVKERKPQFDSLQSILQQSKIEGRPVRRVDLRFDKPVVVYDE